MLCVEVCGLMMGLYVDGTSFPTRPNRHSSFLLLCLAVEARSERVGNSGGSTRGSMESCSGRLTCRSKITRHDPEYDLGEF